MQILYLEKLLNLLLGVKWALELIFIKVSINKYGIVFAFMTITIESLRMLYANGILCRSWWNGNAI